MRTNKNKTEETNSTQTIDDLSSRNIRPENNDSEDDMIYHSPTMNSI